MKRYVRPRTNKIHEITLNVEIYSNSITASSNPEYTDFISFTEHCKEILENEYGFELIQEEQSSRSNSRYFRFRAADSKGGIIFLDVYFELRVSDHISPLNQKILEYNQDPSEDNYNKMEEAKKRHNNFLNNKQNELKVDEHIELQDVVVDSSNYDKAEKQFRKRLGIAMRHISKIN